MDEAEIVARLRAAGCVFAEEEAALLLAENRAGIEQLVQRRVAGEPLEYIVGWAEFHGIHIAVDAGVFVPRRRTELLVDEALRLAKPGDVVVDLCCGAGAIGAAMLAGMPAIDLWAADADAAAVHTARRNLPPNRVFEGDLFDALPEALLGAVDVVVVNAPYVPTTAIETMPPEARLYEHRIALDGGHDGLDLHRRIAADAGRWLVAGGYLLIETSERQAPETAAIFGAHGMSTSTRRSAEVDGTVIVARRDQAPQPIA